MARAATPRGGRSGEIGGHVVSRRALLVGATATAIGARSATAAAQTPTALQLDDASKLNRVTIARHWRPAQVTGDVWLDALRAELKAAASQGRPVSVGSARHSMG